MFIGIEQQKTIWESEAPDTIKVGVIMMYSPIANQLTQYIEDLNKYATVNCVGIVLHEEMETHREWFESNYAHVPFLSCSKDACAQLSLFDAIIIPESNTTIYEYIPSSITKIGLPHGTDIPTEATLCIYGGGFYFDYILSAREQSLVKPEKYLNNFPAAMRLHKYPFVCQLPFGFPKLDKFFNVVTQKKQTKKSIIYHISLLSIEDEWVSDYLLETLTLLLTNFSQYKIVFRVHHFNVDDPKVLACIKLGQGYSNFYYSDADSYIDDYADGAVMVTHREYYNHLFDLATGCPTVLYKKDTDYILQHEHDERYFISTKQNFINVLNQALSANFDTSIENRKQRCLNAGIYNPGGALDYFVEHLEYIVNGGRLPEWVSNNFNDEGVEDIDIKLRRHIISNRPFGPFAMAYAVLTNNSPLSLLLLAESFIRQPGLKSYYLPFGMKYFYQLLHHESFSTIALEAQFWWDLRGKQALNFCIEAVEKGELAQTLELLWLRDKYQYSPVDDLKKIHLKCDDFKIINVSSNNNLKYDDIILYGAGEFAERILKWNKQVKMFNPIAIIDSDTSKHNTLFCDIPVIPPSQLDQYHHNILICSQGSFLEIINTLVFNGIKNQLFGFIDDPLNFLLLNLAIKSSDSLDVEINAKLSV